MFQFYPYLQKFIVHIKYKPHKPEIKKYKVPYANSSKLYLKI